MKAAVLGPSGLIGSAVMTEMRARGHDAIGIGHGNADRQVDLGDPGAIAPDWFAGCNALIHCAGVTDEEVKVDLGHAAIRAVAATEALIKAARQAGVTRFVYVSSAHVYGHLVGDIDEARPADPLSDYALLHFATEQVLRRNLGVAGDSALVLRPCAVFGPLPDPGRFRRWSLVPYSFPRDAVTQGEIRLASAGSQMRNFISSQAIADAILDWLEGPAEGLSLRNALGVDDLSILALAERCAAICERLTGRPCQVVRPPAESKSPESQAPLRYLSRVERPRAGPTLDQHLESIMNAYRDRGANR
ncbi:NAD-dependent epimerase/dehydratase family protein [Dongia sp.]|uniref:NAD-dependent epimerase/dehydratase family protein n=1 Tax=Dongia sp. TaxID=1977262 RepID=UPI0035AF28C6